jgi:death-on-curing protein
MAHAIHSDQIRQHGGAHGMHDEGLLESVLACPRSHWTYDPRAELLESAASYCVGIARNHPFIVGNKRTAFQAAYVFLGLNGLRTEAAEPEVVDLMRNVASGVADEQTVTYWLSGRTVRR